MVISTITTTAVDEEFEHNCHSIHKDNNTANKSVAVLKGLSAMSDHLSFPKKFSSEKIDRMIVMEQYIKQRRNAIVVDHHPPNLSELKAVMKTRSSLLDELRFGKAKGIAWIYYYLHFLFKYTGMKHVGLVVILMIYSILGGVLFLAIETDHQIKMQKQAWYIVDTKMNEFSLKIGNNSRLSTKKIRTIFEQFYWEMLEFEDENKMMKLSHINATTWTFATSTFYAMTLFTTIGYGTIACDTDLGKVVSIVYSILGIPLMLIVLHDIGDMLLLFFQMIYKSILIALRRHRQQKDDDDSIAVNESTEEINDFPLSIALLIVFLYLFLCSIIIYLIDYHDNEKGISFYYSFYFAFISLTTIGLGDIMPKNAQYSPYIAVLFLFGLALISVVISASYSHIEQNYFNTMSILEDVLLELEREKSKKRKVIKSKRRNKIGKHIYENRRKMSYAKSVNFIPEVSFDESSGEHLQQHQMQSNLNSPEPLSDCNEKSG